MRIPSLNNQDDSWKGTRFGSIESMGPGGALRSRRLREPRQQLHQSPCRRGHFFGKVGACRKLESYALEKCRLWGSLWSRNWQTFFQFRGLEVLATAASLTRLTAPKPVNLWKPIIKGGAGMPSDCIDWIWQLLKLTEAFYFSSS